MIQRERARLLATAARFWAGLDTHARFELGDALVLGTLDWRDWLRKKPAPGFWDEVDELRINWEIQESS
jgi:hypothetical protein